MKPARALRLGDVVSVRKDGLVWEIEVTGLAERRGSAADAALLYRELDESAKRAGRRRSPGGGRARSEAPSFDGRPTKRDRRKLQDFLDEP